MLLNKKFILLIACLSLFLVGITLEDTYAKYVSSVNETTDISIARWRILVNNYDIRSNSSTSNIITPVFAGSTHVANGVIAPTASGYFDIVLDASGVDLSFSYNISIANSQDSIVSDIVITRCTLNGTNVSLSNGSTVTGTIALSDQRVNTLRVYIEWYDGTNENMDNEDDTDTTMALESVAKIDVSASFIQVH